MKLSDLNRRTVTVSGPAIPMVLEQPALQLIRLNGDEANNTLFEYQLELKTTQPGDQLPAALSPERITGKSLSIHIELDGMGLGGLAIGAGTRHINGIVSNVRYLRPEGRHHVFGFTLRPWFYLTDLGQNSRIFQEQNDLDTIEHILSAYNFPVEYRLKRSDYPKRKYRQQVQESDYIFVARILENLGISYFFEHDAEHHRLILTDHASGWKANASEAYQHLEYFPPSFKAEQEHLNEWTISDSLVPGSYSTAAYSYAQSLAKLDAQQHAPRQTSHNSDQQNAEVFDYPSEHTQPTFEHDPWADGERLARIRMQQHRIPGRTSQGSGNIRALIPCTYVELSGHPLGSANGSYLVLATTLKLEDSADESGQDQNWQCHVSAQFHPISEPYHPPITIPWPRITGPQSARVIGPENDSKDNPQEIWTDQYSRVRVQFPWDRYGSGSIWIRVATPAAGDAHGQFDPPRVGSEVLVEYEDNGNPDKPVIMAAMRNNQHFHSMALPQNAAVSGNRQRELNGQGGSHLFFDNSHGATQAHLGSDFQQSQLSLGKLTRLHPQQGRQEDRGDGFELYTDGHGAVRANGGLIISSESHNGGHHKTLTAALSRLQQAVQQQHTHAQAAEHHRMQADGYEQVTAALQDAYKTTAGSGKTNGELIAAHLLLNAAADLISSSQGNSHHHSQQNLALTSGGHTSLSSQEGLFINAARRLTMLAHSQGMKLATATGLLDLEAQDGDIQLKAKQDIKLRAKNIQLEADSEITLKVKGSLLKITAEQIIEFMQAAKIIHASSFALQNPQPQAASLVDYPASAFDQQVFLIKPSGKPVANYQVHLGLSGQGVQAQRSSGDGATRLHQQAEPGRVLIKLKPEGQA
ncbi:type VI secretion system tip protein VgrG [Neisseriaceae bacterium TC5R-5]|nr:type VI secretion system tip protein VgrG [Neisseriaceae bacterium TC5R-5]